MLLGKNISVSFGEQLVFENISVSLAAGERVALLGPSGAGKSTLLRILAGIQEPQQGMVSYHGISPQNDSNDSALLSGRSWVWPKITLVFQDLQLFPNLTALENCILGLEGESMQQLIANATSLAATLNVPACMKKIPASLSQGEQQRVAIIRALIRRPEILLMDEPTSAIDTQNRNILANVLLEKSIKTEMGLLVATHDWEFARLWAQKFIVIRNAQLHYFTSITEASSELSGLNSVFIRQ